MTQLFFWAPEAIVNVAQVRHRSPLRYPGGKTWLVPRVNYWLRSLPQRPTEFFEPFAGGAIVALSVAFEEWAEHVTIVELDEDVAALWHTILDDEGGAQWLADRITSFPITLENVQVCLAESGGTVRERAFRTVLRNRVNRGGILAPGAGLIRYGENNKGILSRWYPVTIARRILDIGEIRHRIRFIEGDGLAVIEQNAENANAVFFIDPPYTAGNKSAGSRLYRYSELDHEELFHLTSELCGDFLMTYDNDDRLRALAEQHNFDTQAVAMKNTHHAEMTELLIGRNLNWCRQANGQAEIAEEAGNNE